MKTTLPLLLLTALTAPASAQVVRAIPPAQAAPIVLNLQPTTTATSVSPKKRFEREIEFLIGDMKRSCDLSDAQVRKLQVASKGAVASAMEKHRAHHDAMMKSLQGAGNFVFPAAVVPPGEDDQDEDAVDKEEDAEATTDEDDEDLQLFGGNEIAFRNLIVNAVGAGLGQSPSGNIQSVTQEPRWTNAVRTVVTEQQRDKYAATVKERLAFARKSAVAGFIARVDHKLLLSKDQRTKLTALVDEEVGHKMAKRLLKPTTTSGTWFTTTSQTATPPIDRKELKEFLSEAQLTAWKSSFETELQRLKNPAVIGGGGFGANVLIRPNFAPAPLAPAEELPANDADENDDK